MCFLCVCVCVTGQDIIHPDDVVFYDLVRQCLAVDPRRRIKARDAVNHPLFTSIRGFRKPTEPAFKVPASKQHRLDEESIDALSVGPGTGDSTPRPKA